MIRRALCVMAVGLAAGFASPAFGFWHHCGCHHHHHSCCQTTACSDTCGEARDACACDDGRWHFKRHDHGYANALYYTGDVLYAPVGYTTNLLSGG